MDVFARMVTTCPSPCPLKDDGEVGIGGSDVNNLTNAVHRTRLEGNVLNTGLGETLNYLCGLLRCWNTGSDAEPFNGEALTAHLLPERELEVELARVYVKGVQGDTDTSRDIGLNLGDFGAEGCRVVVTSSGQLDVITGGEDGAYETGLDGRWCHTRNHDRRFAKEPGEGCVNMNGSVAEEGVKTRISTHIV